MTIYLSPTNSIHPHYLDCFGYLVSPRKKAVMREIIGGATWAMDNDCYNQDGQLDADAWAETLSIHHPYRATCLFVAIPDVTFDYEATLKRFFKWRLLVKSLGYPVALVTQDGLKPSQVPWNDLDALFIGGTDTHKRGREGGVLIYEAKNRGKWVHVGRVNGHSTMIEKFWLADSWDGKTIACEPGPQSINLGRAVRVIRGMKSNQLVFW